MMHKTFPINPYDENMQQYKAQSLGFEYFTQCQQTLADKLIQNINHTVRQCGMKCIYELIFFEHLW